MRSFRWAVQLEFGKVGTDMCVRGRVREAGFQKRFVLSPRASSEIGGYPLSQTSGCRTAVFRFLASGHEPIWNNIFPTLCLIR